MNLGIICDVITNHPVGAIAVDQETGTAAYATSIEDLDKTIEIILDNDDINLSVPEKIDGKRIIRLEKLNTCNPQYLTAFNYYLPYPWKILALRYEEGDIEKIVKECYEYMEVAKNASFKEKS